MFDGIDKLWQIIIVTIGAGISYIFFTMRKDREEVSLLRDRHSENVRQIAVVQEQMKGIVNKLNYIEQMCERLEKSNNTILRALARRSKG